MTDAEKIAALTSWLKDRDIPPGIEYRKGEMIQDPVLFVQTQIQVLSIPQQTVFFKNGYMRLWELKQYLIKHGLGD